MRGLLEDGHNSVQFHSASLIRRQLTLQSQGSTHNFFSKFLRFGAPHGQQSLSQSKFHGHWRIVISLHDFRKLGHTRLLGLRICPICCTKGEDEYTIEDLETSSYHNSDCKTYQ